MHQPPIFSGQRILIAPAEEPDVARGLQIVEILRVGAEFPEKELNPALIFVRAIDLQLLARALRFEPHARHLIIHADGDDRSHHEHQQQCEPALVSSLRRVGIARCHPATSASSGSVCWLLLLNCVSSTVAELIPMRMILYRFLIMSPSVAMTISSPSRKNARLSLPALV